MELFPRRYLDDMFDTFMPTKLDNTMKCDVYEKGGNYHIEMDLPGFNKEDISIEAKDGYLTIKASKSNDTEEKDEERNYIRRERSYGKYSRSFYLGNFDNSDVEAEFKNGILKITVPKKEQNNDKNYIEIK